MSFVSEQRKNEDVGCVQDICDVLPYTAGSITEKARYNADKCWKGDTVKVLDDCNMLRNHFILHLDRIINQYDCFGIREKEMQLKFGDSAIKKIPSYLMMSRVKKLTFVNILSPKERCKTTRVSLSLNEEKGKKYMTTFMLNPHHCTKKKDGVDFRELCPDITKTTTIATTTTTTATTTTTTATKTTTITKNQRLLGKGANNQNGNLRWHLPLGVRPPPHNGRTVAPEAILFESPCRAHPET